MRKKEQGKKEKSNERRKEREIVFKILN